MSLFFACSAIELTTSAFGRFFFAPASIVKDPASVVKEC
jgi:hypothetical protein